MAHAALSNWGLEQMDDELGKRDIRDILRERPLTVPQVFRPGDRLHLLCPPGTDPAAFELAKDAFGPFSASVLSGFVQVSIPARRQEAQDLWDLVMRDAMPGEEQRAPGGEPLPTIRTATLGWRLLALLAGSVELLTTAAEAVSSWRSSGQPRWPECPLGAAFLNFRTQGAVAVAKQLERFAQPDAAAELMGYPCQAVLSRYVDAENASVLGSMCERSSTLVAEVFAVLAAIVADPFWRTFMKWKHGTIGTSPGASPLWLLNSPDLDATAVEARLQSGIVVFDAQGGPKIYVWPAQRVDLIGYSQITIRVLDLTETIVESVLGYVMPGLSWPVVPFEVDSKIVPTEAERKALDRLGKSSYRKEALAGLWREPPQ
jgi:hypothetical protein